MEHWILEKAKVAVISYVKANFGREEYLKLPSDQRSLVAAMRCGNNRLRIDMGRRRKEKVQDRICLVCGSGQVEDEKHFLLDCVAYNDLRLVLNARIAAETQMQIGMMEGEEHWLLDALIGCGLGNKSNLSGVTVWWRVSLELPSSCARNGWRL